MDWLILIDDGKSDSNRWWEIHNMRVLCMGVVHHAVAISWRLYFLQAI